MLAPVLNKVLIFILCLSFCPSLWARRNTEWALNADIKLESIYFPEDIGDDTNQYLNRVTVIPYYRWKYKEDLRFFFKGDFTWDPQNKSTEEQIFADATELYLKYSGSRWSIQGGNTIYSWGSTDGYNPLDILNAKQYYDPLHSKKLGAPAITASLFSESWTTDLIFIPKQRQTMMPGPHSRWLPREVFIPQTPENDLVLLLPDNLRYRYGSREELDHALDANVALRLQWHSSNIDITLYGFEGANSFPIVQPVVTGTIEQVSPKTVIRVDPDVTLNLKDYKQRVLGFSWVSSQWDFLLKYGGTYSQPQGHDPLLPGWTQENVIALEKSFNIGSTGTLIAVLQHSFINSEIANDSNLSYTEIFRNSWMLGGRLSWSEVWTANLLGLYNANDESNFAEVSVARRLYDTWTLSFTADFFSGPVTSPLGIYSKNDSYALALSRSF